MILTKADGLIFGGGLDAAGVEKMDIVRVILTIIFCAPSLIQSFCIPNAFVVFLKLETVYY